jgi:hypothetical protein
MVRNPESVFFILHRNLVWAGLLLVVRIVVKRHTQPSLIMQTSTPHGWILNRVTPVPHPGAKIVISGSDQIIISTLDHPILSKQSAARTVVILLM